MERHNKLNINVVKTVSLHLSGVCKCGRHFTVYAEMPETVEVSSGGEVFKVRPAEHVIIVCPACGKLVNCGNGTRRKNRG